MEFKFAKWLESEQPMSPEAPDAKKVMYTACVLQKFSQSALHSAVQKWMFEQKGHGIPQGWIVRCHHMTVKFNPNQIDIEAIKPFLGKEITLQVAGWAADDHGVAVIIKPKADIPLSNAVPHITVAHSRDVGPVYSNTLLTNRKNWIPANAVIELMSEMCCVMRDNTTLWPQMVNPASTTI